jgi:hypothetical protein
VGSAREYASDREDEVTTCKHGGTSLYFDECRCAGCKQDRALYAEVKLKGDMLRSMFLNLSKDKQKEVFALVSNLPKHLS